MTIDYDGEDGGKLQPKKEDIKIFKHPTHLLKGNTEKEARRTIDMQQPVKYDSMELEASSKGRSSIRSKLIAPRHVFVSAKAFQVSAKEAKVYALEVSELNGVDEDQLLVVYNDLHGALRGI